MFHVLLARLLYKAAASRPLLLKKEGEEHALYHMPKCLQLSIHLSRTVATTIRSLYVVFIG